MARRRPKHRPAPLFPSAHPTPPADWPAAAGWVLATVDGAARGNPGPAAYGVIFEDAGGRVLAQLASRIGRTTNNVAEYRALLAALACARERGWRSLRVRTDSELLARQLQGDYRVRSADLKPLHEEAQRLIAALDYFAVEAVPRKLTRAADKLANAALDKRSAISGQRSAKAPSPAASPERSRRAPAAGKRAIRAVYEGGVLRPLGKLDLRDGDEVELTLRQRNKP